MSLSTTLQPVRADRGTKWGQGVVQICQKHSKFGVWRYVNMIKMAFWWMKVWLKTQQRGNAVMELLLMLHISPTQHSKNGKTQFVKHFQDKNLKLTQYSLWIMRKRSTSLVSIWSHIITESLLTEHSSKSLIIDRLA